jgi:Icc-related predicted phosphoesterase
MEDKIFLEQIIKNKNEIKKTIIVSDIIEAIEQFLIVSKEIKTIVDFEEKVRNFMGKGFPYKKDVDTLFLLTSSTNNMKFFFDNLNNFQSIMQGYLNEEIQNIYKNFSEEDIHIKYSSLFYQFEILKDVILKTENKNILDEYISVKASKNLDKTINYSKNPPDWNKILEQIIDNSDDSNEVVIL